MTKGEFMQDVAERIRAEALFVYNTYIKDSESLPSRSALDTVCATYDPKIDQDRYIFDENKLKEMIAKEQVRQYKYYLSKTGAN